MWHKMSAQSTPRNQPPAINPLAGTAAGDILELRGWTFFLRVLAADAVSGPGPAARIVMLGVSCTVGLGATTTPQGAR